MPVHDGSGSDQDERLSLSDQNVRNATRTACAGQLIDGEVVARAEPAIADGEPDFLGRGPRESGTR